MTDRPPVLTFVAGTGTDVGKTWWTAATARELVRRGVVVRARKPVQSGDGSTPWDAEVLAAATGDDPAEVCPPHRTYRVAWAPPMAAAELGEPPFVVDDLVHEVTWPADTAIGLVESVGGPRSPIAADGDSCTLAQALAPDLVVLVADAGLGAINAVRLSAAVLDEFPVVVALNRFGADRLHTRTRELLTAHDGRWVVTTPEALADHLASRVPA
jgi:dethiobiotin synthetase